MDRHVGVLETERLRIRRFTDADRAPFMEYRNDPEVARYQSWEGCSEQEAAAFVEEMAGIPWGVPGRGFQLAVELKETGRLIGDCYLCVDERKPDEAELGFSLSRAYQGRGLAAEAVESVLEYAFHTLQLHRVVAITDCRNSASVRLLEHVGMRREAQIRQKVWFKGAWSDEYIYVLLSEEWRAPSAYPIRRGDR